MPFRALAVAGVFSLAAGQGPPPSDGPMVGLPAGFSVDAATDLTAAAVRAAQPFLKRRGSHDTPPPSLHTVFAAPSFSAKAMFLSCQGAPYPASQPLPEIDAFSLGVEAIPIDPDGAVNVPPGHWSGLVFSVPRTTQGAPGSRIEAERLAGDASADFYSYVFEQADCIPDALIGRPHKLADRNEVALPAGAEVDAIDVFMNLYELGPLLPNLPAQNLSLFFSLEGSPANLQHVPAVWWNGLPASGATVLRSDWNATTGWSCPSGVIGPAELGLDDSADVDLLAIETQLGAPLKVVFSTTSGEPDPLLFRQLGSETVNAIAVHYADGRSISEELGLDQTDDLDAGCVTDPLCFGDHSGWQAFLEHTLSYPSRTGLGLFPLKLATQGYRAPHPTRRIRYELLAVGGQPGGLAVWGLTIAPVYPAFIVTTPAIAIPVASAFAGNPIALTVDLPRGLAGIDLTAQAFSASLHAPVSIYQSHALIMPVR